MPRLLASGKPVQTKLSALPSWRFRKSLIVPKSGVCMAAIAISLLARGKLLLNTPGAPKDPRPLPPFSVESAPSDVPARRNLLPTVIHAFSSVLLSGPLLEQRSSQYHLPRLHHVPALNNTLDLRLTIYFFFRTNSAFAKIFRSSSVASMV